MLTLKTLKKDRRCKIDDKSHAWIKYEYKKGITMREIGQRLGVSRQRISQIIDINGTEEDRLKEIARRNLEKYRNDKKYRVRMLKAKCGYYKYKQETIRRYGK